MVKGVYRNLLCVLMLRKGLSSTLMKTNCYCVCRLDMLSRLVAHNLERYQTSSPPVKYVEFSMGVGDVGRPWVMSVLTQFSRHIETSWANTLLRWTGNWVDYMFKIL